MGYDVFLMGAFMRMGSDSRFKRSLVYGLCLSLCTVTYQRPAHAIVPQLLTIAKLYDQTVANRALQMSEAQFHQQMLSRLQNMGYHLNRSLINELPSFAGTGWSINNALTWGAVAAAISPDIVTPQDLSVSNDTEEITYISDGVPNGDGTYQIIIHGKQETVRFKPGIKNPVIVKIDKTSETPSMPSIEGVETGYSLPNNALYYVKNSRSNLYHYSANSTIDISKSYLQDDYSNSILYEQSYSTLQGDNASYRYLSKAYLFDFEHVGTDKNNTLYPNLPMYSHIAGLPITTSEIYKVTVRRVSYDSEYLSGLCAYQTLNDQRTYVCQSPEPMNLPDSRLISDVKSSNNHLIFSDETESQSVLTKINTAYLPVVSAKNYTFGSAQEMINELSLLAEHKIPTATLTRLLNELMMKAVSLEGYDGLPFSRSTLFTEDEIKQAIKELGYHPTLLDWYGTAADTNGILNLSIKNTYVTIYNTTNNQGGSSNEHKDTDYGDFEPPDIETPPDDFFSLYDELFPFLRDFSIDEKSATCPIVSFDALGHTYFIDTHCPLLEQNRALMTMIMMIVWAFVSLRIVLKA